MRPRVRASEVARSDDDFPRARTSAVPLPTDKDALGLLVPMSSDGVQHEQVADLLTAEIAPHLRPVLVHSSSYSSSSDP